jgi:hypothetical protein
MITNHKRRLQRLEERIRPPSGCPTCANWTRCIVYDTKMDWHSGPQVCPACGADGPVVYTFSSEVNWDADNCEECWEEFASSREEILAGTRRYCPACTEKRSK